MSADLRKLQDHLDNQVDNNTGARLISGIIGDRPSQYAKSPSIWNPVFKALEMPAIYLAFDVSAANLGDLLETLRGCERYMGGSVTVPYKVAVLEHLDEVDDKARRIGAVNTLVRTADGKLVGYNTDGKGGIDCLTQSQPGSDEPFLSTLAGLNVLMIGAGGAAKALGFYLAEVLAGGSLTIANRSYHHAHALAEALRETGSNAVAIEESQIGEAAANVDLIVNCTIKGQSGVRKLANGHVTMTEPYSALATAQPTSLAPQEYESDAELSRAWFQANLADIEANHARSARVALALAVGVRCFDIVYSPLETFFLRQARLSGHPSLNGKGMNIAQAADGLFDKVCRGYLEERSLHTPATYKRILDVMYKVW